MGDGNPFFHNDPLLVLIMQRFHLSPLALLYITFILFPVLLCLWSAFNRTLHIHPSTQNPGGHGFLSPINGYLLLLPFINYAIFSYYDGYVREIRSLFETGTLSGSATVEDFFRLFDSYWAKAITVFGHFAALLLAYLALTWPKRTKSRITNWLCEEGNPRAISYYFHLSFFGIQLAIVFNWILRHILVWVSLNLYLRRANTYPYHPDHMFGLGFLGDLTWYSFEVVSLITVFVTVWLIGVRLTLRKENLLGNPGHVAAIVGLALLAPIIVLLPLTEAHDLMLTAKRSALVRLSARSSYLAKQIETSSRDFSGVDIQNREQLLKGLDIETRLYKFVQESPTWPIAPSAYSAFLIGFLNPIILTGLIEAGRLLRRKIWNTDE